MCGRWRSRPGLPCPLDYHAHGSRQERREQQDYLRRFLPQVSHLPVVLHCRSSDTHPHQARANLLELMQEVGVSRDVKIYIHSFCGDESDVRAWMSAYPRSHFGLGQKSPTAEVLSTIPLDRMLLESDAPYQCKTPSAPISTRRLCLENWGECNGNRRKTIQRTLADDDVTRKQRGHGV